MPSVWTWIKTKVIETETFCLIYSMCVTTTKHQKHTVQHFFPFRKEQNVLRPEIQGLLRKLLCFWWHFRLSNYCLLILPVLLLWPDRAIMMRTDWWDGMWHLLSAISALNKLLNHAETWLKTGKIMNHTSSKQFKTERPHSKAITSDPISVCEKNCPSCSYTLR